ncbi:hypothetical protein ES703_36705 [subsurface metagenome]
MKRFMMSGLIVALIAVGVAMGCGGGETEPTPTPEATPEITPTPTEEIGELPGTFQYSMEWSDSDDDTASMDVWVKGEKSRVDWSMTQDSGVTEFTLIDDGEFGWMYFPDLNQAMKYSSASGFTENYYGTVSEYTILQAMQIACPGGASKGDHETIAGQSCTKFTCNLGDGVTATYWISNSGWLVKGEFTQAGYAYTMEFTAVELNPSISDAMFDIYQVAPDAVIIDMT